MPDWLVQLDNLLTRKTSRPRCALWCWAHAEWQMWNVGPDSDLHDITEACTKHIGKLLGNGNRFEIVWIGDND